MSDRRPENPKLYERTPCEHPEATGPHTTDGTHRRWLVNPPDAVCGGPSYEPVDAIAVVRRGVESGTIKGEVVEALGVTFDEVPDGKDGLILAVDSRGWMVGSQPKRYLLIPVSDGGSET